MRHLPAVIDAMLRAIPTDGSANALVNQLENVKISCAFTAPECQIDRWTAVSLILKSHFREVDLSGWQLEVLKIFRGEI